MLGVGEDAVGSVPEEVLGRVLGSEGAEFEVTEDIGFDHLYNRAMGIEALYRLLRRCGLRRCLRMKEREG